MRSIELKTATIIAVVIIVVLGTYKKVHVYNDIWCYDNSCHYKECIICGNKGKICSHELVMTETLEENYLVTRSKYHCSQCDYYEIMAEDTKEYHLITFIDDDGYNSFYEKLLPIIMKYKISMSTAVETGNVGTGDFMTWETIKKCHEAGAEVLNHSLNHIINKEDCEKLGEEEMIRQMKESIADLTIHGYADTADIYVYPGASAGTTWPWAKQLFRVGINAGGDIVNEMPFNLFTLRRMRIGSDHTPDYDEMKAAIDSVKEINGWEIWMMHSHNGYMTEGYLQDFERIIEYCKENNFQIVSAKQALDYFLIENANQ